MSNANKMSLSSQGDPNFGAVGNGFEDWACENFNLLEYVGQDENAAAFNHFQDPADYNLSEEDSMHKKDLIYSTLQYNELVANDHVNYPLENGYGDRFDTFPEHSYTNGFGQDLDKSQIPSTSKNSVPSMVPIIKQEYDALFDNSDIHGSTTSGSAMSSHDGGDYEPKIKPRKYRIKPETEKRNPQYRVKREKNNDAVRRSRDKAKRLQVEKDQRLSYLENEEIKSKRRINQLEQRNEFLEKELIRMKHSCRCGASLRQ